MKKCLYFICPTDGLEPIIKEKFDNEPLFFCSLGNSVRFGKQEIQRTIQLIDEEQIAEIVFVISKNNSIVKDALNSQEYAAIQGLRRFYRQVVQDKKKLEKYWQFDNPQFLVLSHFLNRKIRHLQDQLNNIQKQHITFGGKIYNKESKTFDDTFWESLYCDKVNLN